MVLCGSAAVQAEVVALRMSSLKPALAAVVAVLLVLFSAHLGPAAPPPCNHPRGGGGPSLQIFLVSYIVEFCLLIGLQSRRAPPVEKVVVLSGQKRP